MSSGIRFAAVRKGMLALGLAALLPMVVHAADPNTTAKKEKVKTPVPTLTANQPQPPAARSPASFTRQTPFSEAIEVLRNSTKPPLNIIVLWRHVEAAGIYRDTPIGIDGIPGLRAGQYLDHLMLSLSAGASAKLGYTVDKGVITISTTDALPVPKLVTRVYDISDLVAAPAQYSPATMGFGMGYGGLMTPFSGYAGNTGAGSYGINVTNGFSNLPGTPYRTTGQNTSAYRGR